MKPSDDLDEGVHRVRLRLPVGSTPADEGGTRANGRSVVIACYQPAGSTEPTECISVKNNQLEVNCQQYTTALLHSFLCTQHSIISLPLPGDLKVEQAHNLQVS